MESKYKYNSWPLGKLPVEWQRQEPNNLRDFGYNWEDPRDIVEIFENKIADFAGSKYCVLTDSATSGIFLALKYRNIQGQVSVPLNTYASVPMQIIHVGAVPVFQYEEWEGLYELGETGIFDSAGRFRQGMYLGDGSLQILSFQIKKRLPIGKGGAILTDSKNEAEWLKLASYDGRDLTSIYDTRDHIQQIGWHCYMSPEDAARGILLMDSLINSLGSELEDTMSWRNYPPLTSFKYFETYKNESRLK